MYVCIKKQTRGRSICIDKRAVNPSGVKVLDLWRIRKNINAKTMFLNLKVVFKIQFRFKTFIQIISV